MQASHTNTQTSFEALEAVTGQSERLARLTRLLAGGVHTQDMAALRGMVAETGGFSRVEVDALVAIEAASTPKCDEWAAFFIDAATDHIVWQLRPTGVVNESQGEWTIAMADRCGTQTALGALANILAEADRAPLWLVAAARARLARVGTTTALGRVA